MGAHLLAIGRAGVELAQFGSLRLGRMVTEAVVWERCRAKVTATITVPGLIGQ